MASNSKPSRSSYTRRRFLAETASAFTGALVLPAFARAGATASDSAQNGPHIAFPTDPRERISIASYPFRDYITPMDPGTTPGTESHARMELKGFAAHVVAKFNIHRIEPWSPHFISKEPSYLAGVKAAFESAEVSVVNIAVDGAHSIFAIDAEERAAAIAESKSWIDVAAAIGSPSVRTHLAAAKDSGPDMARAADSLRHVAEYAATKNVVVNLENDDPVTEDAFFIGKLVATVKSPWVHALPDFANSLVVLPERQAYDALDGMFSQAYNICHVKGLEVNAVGERFRVNFARAFAILKHFNYKGFCSMEFDSPGDPYAGTTDLIKQTLKYLA
ncbi:MAG TPA: TIM barrel protein [Candidatus Dormibacteraeota bacterium]|nr:TIM barrel protein [Candidatus Dormibacteraeota bacterium]